MAFAIPVGIDGFALIDDTAPTLGGPLDVNDYKIVSTGSGNIVLFPDGTGNIQFQADTDSTTFFQVLDSDGGTPVLNVDTTNERVGIGTASPSHLLNMVGGSGFAVFQDVDTDSTDKITRISTSSYDNAEEPFLGMFLHAAINSNNLHIGGGTSLANAATQLKFYTTSNANTVTGTARMTIDKVGNIGIGKTNPGEALVVGTDNGKLAFGAGEDASITYDGTDMLIDSQEVGSGDLIINASGGNVGIGTDAPAYKLDVVGQARVSSNLRVGTYGIISESSRLSINQSAYYPITFKTNNAERLRIDQTGDVSLRADSQKLQFGAGQDASITYDGADMVIDAREVGSGDLHIKSHVVFDHFSRDLYFRESDLFLAYNKWQSNTAGDMTIVNTNTGDIVIQAAGGTIKLDPSAGGDVIVAFDTTKLRFGAGQDASITYDGTDMLIDSQEVGSGDLILNASGGNVAIGHSSPAGHLDILHATTATMYHRTSGAAKCNWLTGATNSQIGTYTDHPFILKQNDTAILTLGSGSASGSIGVNTSTFDGTAAGVIAIANGTAPAAGTANQSYLYARDVSASSEMHVMDEAGNETQISPHDPDTGEWIFFSQNRRTKRRVRVNMDRLIKAVERLTGEKFMIESLIPIEER